MVMQDAAQIPRLDLSVRIDGQTYRLVVRGEIDLYTVAQFEAAAEVAVRSECQRVLIDLGAVRFMDAAGVHALVRIAALAGSGIERLRFVISPQLERLFELASITDLLPLAGS